MSIGVDRRNRAQTAAWLGHLLEMRAKGHLFFLHQPCSPFWGVGKKGGSLAWAGSPKSALPAPLQAGSDEVESEHFAAGEEGGPGALHRGACAQVTSARCVGRLSQPGRAAVLSLHSRGWVKKAPQGKVTHQGKRQQATRRAGLPWRELPTSLPCTLSFPLASLHGFFFFS